MMTNLLNGAHVANKLFSTIARFRLLLVMFLTLTVSANAWGETETLACPKGTISNNTMTWELTSCTIVHSKGSNSNYAEYSPWRVYQGAIVTFTPKANTTISKIVITAESSSYATAGAKTWTNATASASSSTITVTPTDGTKAISLTASAQTRWSKIVITYTTATATKYKVTFEAGSNGTCSTTSLTEASAGAGVTLPNVTPKSGYRFLGWAITSDATTANAGTAGEKYKPTKNITLYAVYVQQCTVQWYADGTLLEEKTYDKGSPIQAPTASVTPCEGMQHVGWTTTADYTHATEAPSTFFQEDDPLGNATFNMQFYAVFAEVQGSTATPTTLKETIKFTNFSGGTSTRTYESTSANWTWKSNGGSNIAEYDEIRLYAKHSMTIAPKTECTISKIVATCTKDSYATALGGSSLDGATKTVSGSTVTITPTSGNIVITQKDQSRVSQFTVTFTTNVASGGKITNYTTTCTAKPTPSLNVDPATLTFENTTTSTSTQKTFTLTGSNLTANASLQLSGINPGMFSLSSNSVAPSAGSINQTVTVTYAPTGTGSHNATLTISSTGAESKTVTLSGTGVAPAAKYTVTFNAGSGTCDDESLTETSGGAGVTLPTANPPAACATDGWKFAGWWTEAVTETTTSPGELLTADSKYKPTSDCTLYAVYSYTEAGGGDSNVTFNFPDIANENSWTNGTAYTTVTISPITINAIGGGNNGKYYTSNTSWRMYNGGSLQISTDIGKITSVSSNPSNTFTINDEGTATLSFSATTEFKSITVSYSSTTYNSNPVCVASWSITYDFADGTSSHCSNTSVPQGAPYTICDEAPTKEGHTFQGWSDGTDTYEAGETITPTDNVILTAQWQIKTYTVTWSNNGTTTPVTYEHGDDLTLPSAPASCDGVKEFVGWTADNTFTYHATTPPSDIFTEKTATVTANATYYAVFATKGEGSANFVLGESGTFKMYANVNGTNYYAQGGVSSSKITSTTEAANASDYTLTYADGVYTIKQGTSNVGNKTNDADLNTNETTWTISEGTNGSWRVTSNVSTSRALSYSTSANAFKAYSISNITGSPTIYYDIEFGGTSSGYSDYTTICQQIESIEVQNPQTEFYITDDFTIGSGKVIATLSGGGTTDVTALATFSGYNMNVVGTYTITVTYMGATATYEINVKPLDNAWVLTWNVSGKTNTGLGPRYVTKGSAISTLPTPVVPDACEGKTFMGWTESNIVPSDGKGIVYITEETKPTDNTTYYAVFAIPSGNAGDGDYVKVTENANDLSGEYLIVYEAGNLAFNGELETLDAVGNTISVTIYSNTIESTDDTDATKFTIAKDGEGDYTIKSASGKYIGRTANDNDLDESESTPYKNTITFTDGNVNIIASGGAYLRYNKNSGAERFRYYKSTTYTQQQPIALYKKSGSSASYTDYTTGCHDVTITYYGFTGDYTTNCGGSDLNVITTRVNSSHTIPNCGNITDPTDLGRTFLNLWKDQNGKVHQPGETFIVTQDITLYAQWALNTSENTTLPTDVEDLATTDIVVTGGTTLTLQAGTTTINSLTLKGGLLVEDDIVSGYAMPSVVIPDNATLVRKNTTINLDLVVNNDSWYPFAVPFALDKNDNIDYLDPVLKAASTYNTHFAIKTYDGENRAKVGTDQKNNWDKVPQAAGLQPGKGYIISALTYPDKDTATIRIPMTVDNAWLADGEQESITVKEQTTTRNQVGVTAYTGPAATNDPCNAGWNFVANPYLTNFAGASMKDDNDQDLDYIQGEIIVNNGHFEHDGTKIPYVTIPASDFGWYDQYRVSDVKLSPMWSFFVQIGTDGTMNFTTAGRQQAPAHLAARAAEQPVKMGVDLILSDDNHSDQTGIIICDRYTDAYEIGHDLEKMFGSAYNLSVYTLMADNTPLAFQALAIQNSMQVIPVGYRTPAQGEYTFALNEATSDIELLNEQYEQLILVDYETGALTNMLNNEYTFYSDRTQSNNRFALYAVPRQNTTTDLPNAIGNEEVKKVIYNDHFYILRDGKVFNGAGQIVK